MCQEGTFSTPRDSKEKQKKTKKNKLLGLSPRANFTDRVTTLAKLLSTFADRVPRSRLGGSPTFSFKWLLCTHEAEWTPFQTHYFSENLVVTGIEPRPSGSVVRNSDH
jgi:hypothetical protein